MCSLVNPTKHLKNFNSSFLKFQKKGEEETHLKTFTEATVTLILVPKQDKDSTHTHTATDHNSYEIGAKLLHNIITNWIQQHIKRQRFFLNI